MGKGLMIAVLLGALAGETAMAGVCAMTTTRVACKGKEKDSYAKCDGQATCTKKSKAATAEECAAAAGNECSNARLDITKSKTIKVEFDGKPVKDNACAADRPDYNKCD